MKALDRGGPVLTRPKVVVSFRGAGWTSGGVTVEETRRAFEATVAGPYLSHLVQYRGIRRAEIVSVLAPDPRNVGVLVPDPRHFVPQVWLISDSDIREMILAAWTTRPPQQNEDVLYVIVVSQDPVSVAASEQNANGFHGETGIGVLRVRYAVLLNQSAVDVALQRRYLPGVFSHELVEACTDPDAESGWVLDDGPQEDKEICDIGITHEVQLPELDAPVELAGYWSELEQAAVVPTTYSLRIALGLSKQTPAVSVRERIGGTSVRRAVLGSCNP